MTESEQSLAKGSSTKETDSKKYCSYKCPVCFEYKLLEHMAPSDSCDHKVCWECYGKAHKASAAIVKCPICRRDFTKVKNQSSIPSSSRSSSSSSSFTFNPYQSRPLFTQPITFRPRSIQEIRLERLENIRYSLRVPLNRRENSFLENYLAKKLQKTWKKYTNRKNLNISTALDYIELTDIEKQMLGL